MNPKEQKFPGRYGAYEVVRPKVDAVLEKWGAHSLTWGDLNGVVLYMATKPQKASMARLRAFTAILAREPELVPELLKVMHQEMNPASKARIARKHILLTYFGMLHDDARWSDSEVAACIGGGVTGQDVRTARRVIIKEQNTP